MSVEMERELAETAYHEAGHAVVGMTLKRYPLSVTIEPDGKGGVGKTEFDDDIPPGAKSHFNESDAKKQYILVRVLIEVSGTIAHDMKFPGRAHDQVISTTNIGLGS